MDKGFAGRLVIEYRDCFLLCAGLFVGQPGTSSIIHRLAMSISPLIVLNTKRRRTHPFSLQNSIFVHQHHREPASQHPQSGNNGFLIEDYVTVECAKFAIPKEKVSQMPPSSSKLTHLSFGFTSFVRGATLSFNGM